MSDRWWKRVRRLRGNPWPVSVDEEVDGEIATHIELHTRHLMRQGMSEDQARAEATRRFGDAERIRAELRHLRTDMDTHTQRTELRNDLRMDATFALRRFRRAPLFTLLLVVTIAVAIGANASIFRVIDAVLLRPLPYQNADRVYVLSNTYSGSRASVSAPEYFDLAEQLRTFEHVAAVTLDAQALTLPGEDAERVSSYVVTPNVFAVLGSTPALGRAFQAGDGVPGGERVVVLSHSLWMRRFGGDRSVVGSSVTLGGTPATVIGVMPPAVRFPDAPIDHLRESADLWIANSLEQLRGDERGNQRFVAVGVARHATGDAARAADFAMLQRRWQRAFPDRYAPPNVPAWRIGSVLLRDEWVGNVSTALAAVAGAVVLLLVVACANVAGLLVAQAAARRRELAVRLALGARRARLVRQLLTESALLGLLGGLAGLAVAWLIARGLDVADPGGIPRLDQARFSPLVIGGSLLVSVLTGLAVGVIPALGQSRERLRDALSDATRGTSAAGARTWRRVLVATQVAVAVVVLVAAALLTRSLLALRDVDTGFAAAGTYFMRVDPPRARYDSAHKTLALYERVYDRIRAAGVSEVSAVYPQPMSGELWGGSYDVPPQVLRPAPELHAEYAVSAPGYFRTAGIALLEGRDFTTQDVRGAAPVVVIDEVVARTHWPNESAIGKQLNPNREPGSWATIVGVVRHVRKAGPRNDGEGQIYMPHAQHPQRPLALVARTDAPAIVVLPALRRALLSADPQLPPSQHGAVRDLVAKATANDRFYALVITAFAATALLLASFGLYGVMAALVQQRQREIAIRVAVGGAPRAIRWLVMREGLSVTLAGLLIGALAAVWSTRVLASLLFGVRPGDPVTYAVIAAIVLTVTLLAAYAPLRRATRVDPIDALRA